MNESALIFITLGAIFLVGLAADTVGRRTLLPRVTMLLIVGFLVGPECFDVLPEGYEGPFRHASEIALTMVGFLLGERLVHSIASGDGRAVLLISIAAVLVTAVVVFTGLWLLGLGLPAALLLAGIATATAPAATVDVVRQCGAKGRFADTLLGVVAIDDAWGLLGFSLLMAGAGIAIGGAEAELGGAWELVGGGLLEIGGALAIGGVLGVAMAYLTGRIAPGEPTLLEAIGFVCLVCGLAIWAGASFILAAMAMGAVVRLLAKHHRFPFHMIEKIELPFMILFFLLAGASLDLATLREIGWFGLAYVVLRIVGRLVGGWSGAVLSRAPQEIRRGIGIAMMPQAGVALGMALLAHQRFPEEGVVILQVAIGSTVFFELLGPIMTRFALARAQRMEASGSRS